METRLNISLFLTFLFVLIINFSIKKSNKDKGGIIEKQKLPLSDSTGIQNAYFSINYNDTVINKNTINQKLLYERHFSGIDN